MRTSFHTQVQSVIEAAARAHGPARVVVIRQMCGGDRALLREVVTLWPHYRKMRGAQPASPLGPLWKKAGSTTFLRRLTGARAMGPREADPPPTYVDQYSILDTIGEGGMGIVYRGEHLTTGHIVAIKMLRRCHSSLAARRRFAYEAEILRPLLHPGIARMNYANTIGNLFQPCRHYFVMEYVKGLSLTDYADKHQLGTQGRLRLLIQICQIVEHAHQRGIIHLDLKPANILVDESGQPKILDFGIAQVTALPVLSLDEGRNFAGTPEYASPEQLASRPADLTARSNVYSLGRLTHELLTGRLPPHENGRDAANLSNLATHADDAGSPATDKRLCYYLTKVLTKALDPLDQRRHRSAGQLGADLSTILASFWPESSWSRWRRHLLSTSANLQNPNPAPNPLAAPLSAILRTRISATMRQTSQSVQR